MSARFSDHILEELRSRCDIIELVQNYLPLKRAGKNFVACCPFHEETKPSFNVNPERQIFKCFGCGKGGNVFHFIMEKEHIEFLDAVKMIADRVGYQLPVEKAEPSEGRFRKQELYDAVSFAVNFYHELLKGDNGRRGMEYFVGRGLTMATLEELKLGFAPSGSVFLAAAKGKDFSSELLEAAGLLVKEEGEGLRDKFVNRVMFPIFSPEGRAIGFSGRVIEDREPKYMNSPETPLFSKSRILYGINFTRDEMVKQQHGIICEGHIDFATLYQNGIRNAVAAQGTAFTSEQAHLLKRYVPKVTFAFDSDRAGKKAVVRSLEPLLGAGLEVRVAEIPEGDDPDSFVRKKGADMFRAVVSAGKDFFEFLYGFLTTEHDMSERQGKLAVAGEMLVAIKKMSNEIVREELLQKLSHNAHISIDALRLEMKKIRGDYRPFSSKKDSAADSRFTAEEELIHYMLRFNESFDDIATAVNPENFQRPHCRALARIIFALAKEKEKITYEDVLIRVEDEKQREILTEMMMIEPSKEEHPLMLGQLIDGVLTTTRNNRKDEIKRMIEEAMREGRSIDPELNEEYMALHRDSMRRRGARFVTRK
jgi:DNA primase